MESMKKARYYSTAYYENGSSYAIVIGGRIDNDSVSSSCELLDIADQKWHSFPDLIEGRSSPSTMKVNDFLYVFAGFILNRTAAKIIERINMKSESPNFEPIIIENSQVITGVDFLMFEVKNQILITGNHNTFIYRFNVE